MSNEASDFTRWVVYVQPVEFSLAGGVQLIAQEDQWVMTTTPKWPGDNPVSIPATGPVWSTEASLSVKVFDVTYTFHCREYDPEKRHASGTLQSSGEDDGTWTAQGQTGGGPIL